MIYLVIYLIISVLFTGVIGSEAGQGGQAILAGYLWPLTLVWFLFMYWAGRQ